jgi:nucleotide-binding universal stress UspA family protein
MKKIIAAFDGQRYSEGATKYAIELATASDSLLVGVFIQDMRYLNYTYSYVWDQPFVDFTAIDESQAEEKEKIDLNIKLFRNSCEEQGVNYKVHLDKGVPLQELLRESIFSDLLIIDSHTGFFSIGNEQPSPFLKDLLVDSHCPVLIVPHTYSAFDKLVLSYDGSPSSVHAIKMFSYLFPELDDMPTTLVSINENSSNHLASGTNIKDLLKVHYPNSTAEVLNGTADKELINYLKGKANNAIVVMGAYGRNAISRMFQQSMSNRVIKELNVPVFITHQ